MPVQIKHNNGGVFYNIALDIAKEGSQLFDLTPYVKGRVGDNGFGLVVTMYRQGALMNVNGGYKPVIDGLVGNYSFEKNGDLKMNDDASPVYSVGKPEDCGPAGQVTYYFPEQMFPKEGIFKGYLGLIDDKGNRYSGVDIWFAVLAGNARMGVACDFYISELQKAIATAEDDLKTSKKSMQDVVDEFVSKMNDLTNRLETQANTDQAALDALEQKIKQDNLFTQAEAEAFKQAIMKAVSLTYSTVDSMKQADLQAGQYAETKGYYLANDGGGASYLIMSTQPENKFYEVLANGMYAALIADDYVNVKQLGVLGDDRTNNTSLIQAAINKIGANQKNVTLYFPSGTYLIDNLTVPVECQGITLKGQSTMRSGLSNSQKQGATILKATSETSTMVQFADTEPLDQMAWGFKAENIYFLSDSHNANCINGVALNECRFTNVEFGSWNGFVLRLEDTFDSKFNSVFVHNCGSDTTYPIVLVGNKSETNALHFLQCRFEDNYGDFDLQGKTSQITFDACKFEASNKKREAFKYSDAFGPVSFSNCTITSAPKASYYFFKFKEGKDTQTTMTGCQFDCSDYGISGGMYIDSTNSFGLSVNSCHFNGINSEYGLILDKAVFQGNTIYAANQDDAIEGFIRVKEQNIIKNNFITAPKMANGQFFQVDGTLNDIRDNSYHGDIMLSYDNIFNASLPNDNRTGSATSKYCTGGSATPSYWTSDNYVSGDATITNIKGGTNGAEFTLIANGTNIILHATENFLTKQSALKNEWIKVPAYSVVLFKKIANYWELVAIK
ncbi:glycoside hydrolase family 55 protein [Limosilactobacillus reuteri]|uniref:OmpH family outer membrane protein n=1 Tax=Limosilactobacillus reuteri TaxID=1598 RepID=UPI001E3EC298|nr:OmpH family outer membrane protein [Limosilactobacillus reuteri]MCC4383541.1 glycoside hydrolase family 55 protein [Limosilactobacillus reuteri]MCC4420376.1 glycoside hydrolase family 55 protein [Limosilactobacillus reuteri]MCC4422810.1 glycoside hydrolase family 55 protein [Limosilactobacillus reuteri]